MVELNLQTVSPEIAAEAFIHFFSALAGMLGVCPILAYSQKFWILSAGEGLKKLEKY